MKKVVLASIVLLSAIALGRVAWIAVSQHDNMKVNLSQSEMGEIFRSWKIMFQVEYSTPEEETYRLGVFSRNYNYIIELNSSQ